jgi:5-methylcytosine-specific restriction endonuclease McrA
MARPKVSPARLARTRLAVYARDGYRCLHCGWDPKVPPNYDGRTALGETYRKPNGGFGCRILELDHVLPYSLGGEFTVENLQALCNSCNARKGAKV